MQSIQKLVEDQERVCVAASASHIFVAAGSRLLVASKLAGTFPDYGRILVEPATSPVFMVMQRRSPAPWRRAPFTAMPDKTVGTDINGCAVTEFTVTPFGTNVVAAEWKEGACAGGNMLLQEVGQ
jgi:hypothetical protein